MMVLPGDVQDSRPPFHALGFADGSPGTTPWSEMELLYNPIPGQIPVSVHFTGSGEKELRKLYWQRLWFQRRAKQLRLAAQKLVNEPISSVLINDLTWYNANP